MYIKGIVIGTERNKEIFLAATAPMKVVTIMQIH